MVKNHQQTQGDKMGNQADLHKSELLKTLLAEAKDATAAPDHFRHVNWLDRMPLGYFSALALSCVLTTIVLVTALV